MKKILVVLIAIVLALLIAGTYIFKTENNEINENLPEINSPNPAMEEPSYIYDEKQETDTTEIKVKTNNKQSKSKVTNKLNFSIKNDKPESVNAPITTDTEQVSESARKFTPEEEELLKKIPASKEVVVDKEIKIKSSGKYIFK